MYLGVFLSVLLTIVYLAAILKNWKLASSIIKINQISHRLLKQGEVEYGMQNISIGC
jgi:hypothetical protein